MDFSEAKELLGNAISTDEGAGTPPLQEGATPPVSSNPDPATPTVDEGSQGVTQEDSFTGFDPSALPQDLQEVYKSMQRDYTRKTQELAEQRKAFDQIEDPVAAAEAMQFVQAIQTDPNYAMQVHAALTRELQEAGLSPYEAAAAATESLQGVGEESQLWTDAGDEFGVVPPEIAQELSELKQWRQQMEEQQLQQQWENELARQTNAIQQQHPEYQQSDLEAIYQLAWATEGDLFKAQEAYENIVTQRLQGYLNQKSQVPSGTPVSSGSAAAEPQSFSTLDEAHNGGAKEAFLRYLRED